MLGAPLRLRAESTGLKVVVDAGPHDRRDSPVRLTVPRAEFLKLVGLEAGNPEANAARLRPESSAWRLVEEAGGASVPVQIDTEAAGEVTLTWVLAGPTRAHATRRFVLHTNADATAPLPWSFGPAPDQTLELGNRDRTVFRYHPGPTRHPNYPAVQTREAYIHPAFTPDGHLITGDFSRAHPHHRGFFLAYTKTSVGGAHPDFWNLHTGSGQIHCERLGKPEAGPVLARFEATHRWEATGLGPVLRERWQVVAYDIPGSPYWLFDLTSTQEALDRPLTLEPHRYGGMAYRGPDAFLNPAVLDVLTSAGLDRVGGDQKPARWVDLTGPVAPGSALFGGALIADHPDNPGHPTVARIHPTSLPFFSYVPAHDQPLRFEPGQPRVFRYRILIHDGHPDRARNEAVWHDLAEPPRARIEAVQPGSTGR